MSNKNIATVTLKEHFSSMGTTHSYDLNGHWYSWGLPLAVMFPGIRFGTGAKFRVSVEVLRRGRRQKNPWQRRKRKTKP